jgi:hypothetical protein
VNYSLLKHAFHKRSAYAEFSFEEYDVHLSSNAHTHSLKPIRLSEENTHI